MGGERDEGEEVPDYLERYQHESLDDEFGPEDVAWTGRDGDVDPEALIAEYGYDPDSPLVVLLRALILGHSPSATPDDIAQRLRRAVGAITGKPQGGRPSVDDYDALLEIAWRYHVAVYNTPKNAPDPSLRPMVREVFESQFADVPKERNITADSYIESLENKFLANKDLFLSRATMDEDWDRMDSAKEFSTALEALEKLGIQVDKNEVGVRTRRKMTAAHRDKNPRS